MTSRKAIARDIRDLWRLLTFRGFSRLSTTDKLIAITGWLLLFIPIWLPILWHSGAWRWLV